MSYKLAGAIWNDDGTLATKTPSPLEALKDLREDAKHHLEPHIVYLNERLDIIETALKEKEQQDNVLKVLKEVIQFNRTLPAIEISDDGSIGKLCEKIALKQLRDIENKERELLRQWVLKTCFPKELKALEIIKEKTTTACNCLMILKCRIDDLSYENYKKLFLTDLIQEEYDLLKEVLL